MKMKMIIMMMMMMIMIIIIMMIMNRGTCQVASVWFGGEEDCMQKWLRRVIKSVQYEGDKELNDINNITFVNRNRRGHIGL